MPSIQTEAEYDQALARLQQLWGARPNPTQAAELDALAASIEAYESIELDRMLPPAAPGPLIAYKLRELGLPQNDLARRTGLSSGRISEIINGRRGLTLDHVRRIAEALQIDPALLVHDASPAPDRAVLVRVDAALTRVARAHGWLDHPSLDALVNAALTKALSEASKDAPVVKSGV